MKAKMLEGKIAIITGGARGIGRAFAARFVAEGAKVAIADILIEQAQEAAQAIGEDAMAVQLDVTKQTSIDAMVKTVVDQWGGIDILVNNAAIFDMAPIVEITERSYDKVFAVNVKGLLFTLQAVARQMIEQGRGGKIINMASQAGRPDKALAACRKALQQDPKLYWARLREGEICMLLGLHTDAAAVIPNARAFGRIGLVR